MKLVTILFLLFSLLIQAQGDLKEEPKTKSGYYLEDQIYIGASYNLLRNKPASVNLRGVSNTIFMGLIRDVPFNEQRNFGMGVGLGYARDTYFHNMKISNSSDQLSVSNFEDFEYFTSNKLLFHKIEMPIQIRWRKSTIDKYKFFRLYSGVNLSYVFSSKSEFDLNGIQKYKDLNNINKLQYGLSISMGHGTWNGFVYYGLNSLFKDVNFNNEDPLNLKSFKFGLMFYIM
ncbi:MAG: porin family protein [Flavobacteriaceae bacterium]